MRRKEIRNLDLYFKGSLLLNTWGPSVGAPRGEFLIARFPHQFQPWVFELRGSRPTAQIFRNLVARTLLQERLSAPHKKLRVYLASEEPGWTQIEFLLRKTILGQNPGTNETWVRTRILSEIRTAALRVVRSYSPEVFAGKIWKPTTLIPQRRIGVGYKDKGTYSPTSLSWRDQVVFTEEDNPKEKDGFLDNLRLYLSLLESPDFGRTSS